MIRFLTLVAFIAIMYVVRLMRMSEIQTGSTTLFLGFLLLASYLAGRVARAASLPQITGYLVIGVVVVPRPSGGLSFGPGRVMRSGGRTPRRLRGSGPEQEFGLTRWVVSRVGAGQLRSAWVGESGLLGPPELSCTFMAVCDIE